MANKPIGYLIAKNEEELRKRLLDYRTASLVAAQQSSRIFIVMEFNSIREVISCLDPDCYGCLEQKFMNDPSLYCNECGKEYILSKKE